MKIPRIIIDTNVLIAALRSRRGASYKLLMHVDTGTYELVVSVALVLEYEATAKRLIGATKLTDGDIEAVIDYLCAQARVAQIFYLWRPLLKDPDDDMLLEAAVAAGCTHIVTYNGQDFAGAERFGITVVTPREILAITGEEQ